MDLLGSRIARAVRDADLFVVIGQQREREVELVAERLVLRGRVEADAQDLGAQLGELVGLVTQALALNRSTGSIGLRVPPQQYPAAAPRGQGDRIPVVVGHGEVGCSRSLGEHGVDVTATPASATEPSTLGYRPRRMREDRIGPGTWAALALAAVCVRALYILTAAPRKLPFTDALFYHLQANQISHGMWFREPIGIVFLEKSVPSAAHPPLYPLVLAAASSLGARSVRGHELVGCVIGAGTVVGVTLLTRNLAGKRAGLIAGFLAAIYPPLWLNDGGVMSEGLYALVIVLVLLASYRFVQRPGAVNAAIVGLTVGVAALVRAEAILLVVVLLVPLVVRFAQARRPALLAVAFATCALVLAPWVTRNMVVFSRPVTLSTGDSTVAGANCPQTYGGSTIGLWLLNCYDSPPPGDESVASAFWRHQGVSYAKRHVDRMPLVATVRVARIWGAFRPIQTVSFSADDGRARWTNYVSVISYWLIAPLGLAGLVVLYRRKTPVLPLLAQLLLVTVTAVLVWGAVRFRVPAEIVLVVGAGVTLDWLLQRAFA